MIFKIAILGGCFPVQEQINNEELYHSIIKEKIKKEKNIDTEFVVFRYDTFRQCKNILDSIDGTDISCILLHIRPDPFLQAVKIYRKYINKENSRRNNINIHFTGFSEPEINPVNFGTVIYRNILDKYFKKQTRRILRNLNYVTGIVIRNNLITKKIILNTIKEINDFSIRNGIKLVIQGPPMRPRSFLENTLLKNLGKYIAKSIDKETGYVPGFFRKDNSGNFIFLEDKIHLNEFGHQYFANLIYGKLNLCETDTAILSELN